MDDGATRPAIEAVRTLLGAGEVAAGRLEGLAAGLRLGLPPAGARRGGVRPPHRSHPERAGTGRPAPLRSGATITIQGEGIR